MRDRETATRRRSRSILRTEAAFGSGNWFTGSPTSHDGYNQYGFGQPTPTLAEVQALYGQIGATVRRLRLKRGWTQDVLSDRSGLHRAHIGEIERGETNVTLQTLKTLADTLKVRITDLLDGP